MADYGKPKKKKSRSPTKPKTVKKKSRPKIEPTVKIISGEHEVIFKKASELNKD